MRRGEAAGPDPSDVGTSGATTEGVSDAANETAGPGGPGRRFGSENATQLNEEQGQSGKKSASGGSYGTGGIQGTVCQTPSSWEFGGRWCIERRKGTRCVTPVEMMLRVGPLCKEKFS